MRREYTSVYEKFLKNIRKWCTKVKSDEKFAVCTNGEPYEKPTSGKQAWKGIIDATE